MKTLTLDIVTPTRSAFSKKAKEVYLPAEDGEMGVLEAHENYVTLMGSGVVRVEGEDNQSYRVGVRGGFLEVTDDQIVILADEVKLAGEVTASAVQTRLGVLDKELSQVKEDAEKTAALLEEQAWLTALLELSS